MRKTVKAIVCIILILLQSCIVPHKSFVAPGFEPVTVKQKGDLELSASIRPLKFYKFNATLAVKNWMAVRIGYSGFPGLDNFDASLIAFTNFERVGFFAGPTYNYQQNLIKRHYSFSFFNIGRDFAYNCSYHSPGAVVGISFFNRRGNTLQFILKASYNMVDRYNYFFSANTASGKNSGYSVSNEETLNYKIQNFFSIEPSYSIIVPRPGKKVDFRFQLSLNICEPVLSHTYSYDSEPDGGPLMQTAVNLHPVYSPANFSIGFIFRHNVKKASSQ